MNSGLKPPRSEEGSLRDEIPQAGLGAVAPTSLVPRHSLTRLSVLREIYMPMY